jgi:hypothetical protein
LSPSPAKFFNESFYLSCEFNSPTPLCKGLRRDKTGLLILFYLSGFFCRIYSVPKGSTNKLLSAANFTGIALFALLCTKMQFKDKWIACLSLGEQTFRTKSSQQLVQFIIITIILYASFILFLLLSLIFCIHFICLCRTDKLIWNYVSTLISILFIIS